MMKRMRLITRFFMMLVGVAMLFANSQAIAAFVPVEFLNNSGIAADKVFITIKASLHGKDCLMKFNESGEGLCEEVTTESKLSQYAYKLSEFPLVADNLRGIYLPQVAAGRIYISYGDSLELFVDPESGKIPDPDGFKPRDRNYYKLYDKIEFSYDKGGIWINPTAVDFFSLPISIQSSGSTSGILSAGFTESRADIISQVKHVINSEDKTTSKIWNKLFLYYKDNDTKTLLRIMAPAKAMATGVPGTDPFDPQYLNKEKTYGFNYIKELWKYYETHDLIIDCKELKPRLDSYLFTGRVVDDKFVFTNPETNEPVVIEKPDNSIPFFAGAVGKFDAPNNTPRGVIIRDLTSAFEVGLLPKADNKPMNKAYFTGLKGRYYQDNSLLPATTQGPWYDLYSKALHSLGEHQPIYTFAYDDALGQDGTLHDSKVDALSTVVITLGDMTGTIIPDPNKRDTGYTIMPIIAGGSSVFYKGQPLESNQEISDVNIPFQVNLNSAEGKQIDIYIKPPQVKPHFKQADGIVITPTGKKSATIIFPAIKPQQ